MGCVRPPRSCNVLDLLGHGMCWTCQVMECVRPPRLWNVLDLLGHGICQTGHGMCQTSHSKLLNSQNFLGHGMRQTSQVMECVKCMKTNILFGLFFDLLFIVFYSLFFNYVGTYSFKHTCTPTKKKKKNSFAAQ